VLVPATMTLFGRLNWWLPAWLDRVLPKIDVEGGERATGLIVEGTAEQGEAHPAAREPAAATNKAT